MKIQLMPQDIHSPAFIRANSIDDTQLSAQPPTSGSKLSCLRWRSIIKLMVLLGIVSGALFLLSRVITPQLITAISILIGFVVLRFIARTILQITFTLLRYLFWIIVLIVILLCVL